MRIMVFDVPAESGGALSILLEFYNQLKNDIDNEYYFVVSKPQLEDTSTIKVLRFPWIKKSWLHRLYFDNFIAPKLVREHSIDKVFSLQNVIIPHTNVQQIVYVHNALPFVKHRFSITQSKLLWIHQNILSKSIFASVRRASEVIVQTEWMKKKCIDMLNVNPDKVKVLKPKLDIKVKSTFIGNKESLSTFFYPASSAIFKNHKIIIDACIELKARGVYDYKVVLTLNGDENEHISALYKKVKEEEIPVHFVGSISREEVFEYYTKSVLLFPSYVETVGLPLLEARAHDTPIIASNCYFSVEVLDRYTKRYLFNPFDHVSIARLMERLITKIHKDDFENFT